MSLGEENGRVTFGDAPGNSLNMDQVTELLRLWWKADRAGMSAYVGEAVTGVAPRPKRKARQ